MELQKPRPTTEKRFTTSISLLSSVLGSQSKEHFPWPLIQDGANTRWDWTKGPSEHHHMLKTLIEVSIPALRNGLNEFLSILTQYGHLPASEKSITNPRNVKKSLRLQIAVGIIDQLESCIPTDLPQKAFEDRNPHDRTPATIGTLDLVQQIQWGCDQFVRIAQDIRVEINTHPKHTDPITLPTFAELRADIHDALLCGDEDIDPRVSDYTCLQEWVEDNLPSSLRIHRKASGMLTIAGTAWEDAQQPGQEKRFLWILQHGILPAIAEGVRDFQDAIAPELKTCQDLDTILNEDLFDIFSEAVAVLSWLEEETKKEMERVEAKDPEAFGEAFRETLRELEDIQPHLTEGKFEGMKIMLEKRIATELPDAELMKSLLRSFLYYLLRAIAIVDHRVNPIDYRYEHQEPPEPKAIKIPGFVPHLPPVFSPPHLDAIDWNQLTSHP